MAATIFISVFDQSQPNQVFIEPFLANLNISIIQSYETVPISWTTKALV